MSPERDEYEFIVEISPSSLRKLRKMIRSISLATFLLLETLGAFVFLTSKDLSLFIYTTAIPLLVFLLGESFIYRKRKNSLKLCVAESHIIFHAPPKQPEKILQKQIKGFFTGTVRQTNRYLNLDYQNDLNQTKKFEIYSAYYENFDSLIEKLKEWGFHDEWKCSFKGFST